MSRQAGKTDEDRGEGGGGSRQVHVCVWESNSSEVVHYGGLEGAWLRLSAILPLAVLHPQLPPLSSERAVERAVWHGCTGVHGGVKMACGVEMVRCRTHAARPSRVEQSLRVLQQLHLSLAHQEALRNIARVQEDGNLEDTLRGGLDEAGRCIRDDSTGHLLGQQQTALKAVIARLQAEAAHESSLKAVLQVVQTLCPPLPFPRYGLSQSTNLP